jgi:glyoxylase-like metal-dependent hydrolase (beta-lactamase superfamily II)
LKYSEVPNDLIVRAQPEIVPRQAQTLIVFWGCLYHDLRRGQALLQTSNSTLSNNHGVVMLHQTNEHYRGLNYPWGRQQAPEPLKPFPVAEGVWWVRMPMPMALDHINLWLLEDGDGWTVVDTGLASEDSRAIWEGLFEDFMGGKPVLRVICTHMHPDHIGLAGWLCEQFDCPLWMTREEYVMCQLMASYTGHDAPKAGVDFYRGAGFDNDQLDQYRRRFGTFGAMMAPMPHCFRRMVDRETITIGDRYWQVIVGSGHSPEHACLYCPALKILIAGDQVLPRITPNVSVFPTEPEGNPLAEWMDSNARLLHILPNDLLVLPAHQNPFHGLHIRINQIIDSHRQGLQSVYDYLEEPKRAVDCFPSLFRRKISDKLIGLATGETLANLNLLLQRGNISKTTDEAGVHWYTQNPDARYIDNDEKIPLAT